MTLEREYTVEEVAAALRMSESWLYKRVSKDGVECQKYGRDVRFTAAQVDALRDRYQRRGKNDVADDEPITTGRKKSA